MTDRLERLIEGLPAEPAERARRFRSVSEVPIGELGTHPDLGERLGNVVRHLSGVEFGVCYRVFAARTRQTQRWFALAQGTHIIRFRLGAEGARAEQREGVAIDPEWGGQWVKVDAWNPHPPAGEWMAFLERLAGNAQVFVESEP